MSISKLAKDLKGYEKFPPVDKWNPDLCEGQELFIDREGNWFYNQSTIKNQKFTNLFSTVLKNEDKYLLFRQLKYGLERPYLALVGGLFNENESALDCAIRELLEETGLIAEEMINLGRYRVQVNRGGGILNAFLARNAVPKDGHNTFHQLLSSEQGGDYEKQTVVKLTLNEVIDYALKGEIGEAQWTAVAALGVLYQQKNKKNN